jgi:hypothetical protein
MYGGRVFGVGGVDLVEGLHCVLVEVAHQDLERGIGSQSLPGSKL